MLLGSSQITFGAEALVESMTTALKDTLGSAAERMGAEVGSIASKAAEELGAKVAAKAESLGMSALDETVQKALQESVAKDMAESIVTAAAKKAGGLGELTAEHLTSMTDTLGNIAERSVSNIETGMADINKALSGLDKASETYAADVQKVFNTAAEENAAKVAKMGTAGTPLAEGEAVASKSFASKAQEFATNSYNSAAKVSQRMKKAWNQKPGALKFDAEGKPVPARDPISGDILKNPDGSTIQARWTIKEFVGTNTAAGRLMGSVFSMAGGAARKVWGLVEMLGMNGMVMGMAFSVPGNLLSSFVAEKQRQATLATIARPITFGGILMQVPDDLINQQEPYSSGKLYVGIPGHAGDILGGGGSTPSALNPVVGVDGGNPISQAVTALGKDTFKAAITTLMSAQNELSGTAPTCDRYSFFAGSSTDASWYDQAHFFCSYSAQSWTPWAGSFITDNTFDGLMIDLNTGYVFAEDGTTEGNPPAVLLGSGSTVQGFLSNYASQLAGSSNTYEYSQYSSGGNPTRDFNASNALQRQFSAVCIGADALPDACIRGNFRNSLLATALQRMQRGTCIDHTGNELIAPANDVLQNNIALGALAGVAPISGQSDLQSYLNNHGFKNMQLNASDAGAFAIITNQTVEQTRQALQSGVTLTGSSTATNIIQKIEGAPKLNYAALGVYVYESSNTPFAAELATLAHVQALDYIIFFDQNLNLVPLQVPETNDKNFNIPDFKLNPQIAYWASLISCDLDEFLGRYQDDSGNTQTFTPLYTLDGNIAKVSGADSAIATVIHQIQSGSLSTASRAVNTVALAQQIQIVKSAQVQIYRTGPFYKPYNLVPSDSSLNMSMTDSSGKPVTVVSYIGKACYPAPQSPGAAVEIMDYLVPFANENGNATTVQLPNPYVNMFVSLVTDILFSAVVVNGQTTFTPISFDDSQYNPNTGLDTSKPQGVWLEKFQSSGLSIPAALTTAVDQSYNQWVSFVQSLTSDPTFAEQAHGFPFGQTYTLTIVNQADYSSKNYMYLCSPSPSGIADDLYVMSAQQSIPNNSIGLIANAENPQPYIVSMATGFMYDSNGDVVSAASGKPVNVDPQALPALARSNQKGAGPSAATLTHLAQIQQEGQSVLGAVQGPYEFGSLLLHLYEVDVESNNFVYFVLDSNNVPSDYFVVAQSVKSPFAFGGAISGSTQYMVSLITGQLYTRSGFAGTWPNVSSLLGTVQQTMSISAVDLVNINKLTADFLAQQQAEAAEKSALQQQETQAAAQVTEDISNIVANIVARPYLPAPYDSLVQDVTGKFYRITPGPDGNPYFIFDFNATNSAQDLGIGAMFINAPGATGDTNVHSGSFVSSLKGIHLAGMRQQFGVEVGSDGKQKLTIPHVAGNLNLNSKDQAIVAGKSGTALLASNDANFPSLGVSTITQGTMQYYFYYHTFLQSYFVLVNNTATKDQYYISIEDGTMFNKDGSARFHSYQVARDSAGNPLLIGQDENGMLTMTAMNPLAKPANMFMDFGNQVDSFTLDTSSNVGLNAMIAISSPYNSVWVAQSMPTNAGNMVFNPTAKSYSVYWSDYTPTTFTLDSASQAQGLVYVPINPSTGMIKSATIDSSLQSAYFIQKSGTTTGMIFGGLLYTLGTSSGNSMTFKNGNNPSLQVTLMPATASSAAYATVIQGSNSYTYSYAYQSVLASDLVNYQTNVWKLSPAIATSGQSILAAPFNPVALKTVDNSSVQGIPASRVAAITISLKNLRFDAVSGRYFSKVATTDYAYFPEGGYVDISNGALYESTGMPQGSSLIPVDFSSLLDKLSVMISYNNITQKSQLIYRSPQAIATQTAALTKTATAA